MWAALLFLCLQIQVTFRLTNRVSSSMLPRQGAMSALPCAADGEGLGQFAYSHGPGASSLTCHKWQGVRGMEGIFLLAMPPQGRSGSRVCLLAFIPSGLAHLCPCQQCQLYRAAQGRLRVCSPQCICIAKANASGGQCQFSRSHPSGPAHQPATGGKGRGSVDVIPLLPTPPHGRGKVGPDLHSSPVLP